MTIRFQMSGEDMIARFSQTLEWQDSAVRCLAFHPHTAKVAVAYGHGDAIHVVGERLASVPVLKYKQQKGVR